MKYINIYDKNWHFVNLRLSSRRWFVNVRAEISRKNSFVMKKQEQKRHMKTQTRNELKRLTKKFSKLKNNDDIMKNNELNEKKKQKKQKKKLRRNDVFFLFLLII